jgi:hypothetical protein
MHLFILGVATVLTGGAGAVCAQEAPDPAPCARAHAAVFERFISAECSTCWTDASTEAAPQDEWLLDWIVPSARGDDAPLSPAAPSESADRARRVLTTGVNDARTVAHRTLARSANPGRLTVAAGPAFHGYVGVQLDGSGRWPAGTSAWVALVESVNASTGGTPVPRQLVRTVAGPFQPPELRSGKPWRVLQALRWPEISSSERLRARAWLERADGRIVAMAGERCTQALRSGR